MANSSFSHRTLAALRRRFVAALLLALAAAGAAAQDIRNPQSAVDNRMRTDLRVDPVSHALQFQITLGQYTGRGGAGLPVTLNYSSKVWNVKYMDTVKCQDDPGSLYRAEYAKSSAAGWTSSLDWFIWPEDISLELYDGFTTKPSDKGTLLHKIARMHVTLPDGSRHELRKDDDFHAYDENVTGLFYSVDGSRLIYDTATNTLYLPDGSRYTTTYDPASGAPTTRTYTDRNGNQLSYDYTTRRWTDTLGRHFDLPLAYGAERSYTYSLPGTGGYTFRWKHLSSAGVINEQEADKTLRYPGDHTTNCQSGTDNSGLFHSTEFDYNGMYKGEVFDPVVLYQIELPTGQSYTFKYNIYGEVSKVIYPTGGYERFSYGPAPKLSAEDGIGIYAQASRGVSYAWVSPDGVTEQPPSQYDGFNTIAPDGTRTERSVYTNPYDWSAYGFEDPRLGMAYDEKTYSPSGQMLRRRLTEYAVDGEVVPYGAYYAYKQRNPRPTKTVEILLDTGGQALAATTKYGYDSDLNQSWQERYAFVTMDQTTAQTGQIDSVPQGTLLRREETDYLTSDQSYRARNLLSLPTATRVKDGAGNVVAQTQTFYDETALTAYNAVTNWVAPGTPARGNATRTRRWLDTTNTWVETRAEYDQCGSPVKTVDTLGNESSVSYSADYARAYPTQTTAPVPDPTPGQGGAHGSSSAFQTTTVYDFDTGRVISTEDINRRVKTYSYSAPDTGVADPLGRLRKVTLPDGGWTRTDYGDGPGGIFVRVRKAIDASRSKDIYQYFDGLSRPSRAYSNDGSTADRTWVAVKTTYDLMGRVATVCNPQFRSDLSDFTPPAGSITSTEYDWLGRVRKVTTPDGAFTSTTYDGYLTASLNGSRVTVTDQAGKQRSSVSDALGQLAKVIEAPDAAGYGYETAYEYDALGSLRTLTQGKVGQTQQTRRFAYDSLSRLTSAANPESGTVAYEYDLLGNLKQKRDARHVQTDYVYDALSRVTKRSYSIEPGQPTPAGYVATPEVNYFYDGTGMPSGVAAPGDSLGRLTAVKSAVSETAYTEFDVIGRVRKHRQIADPGTTSEQTYLMEYGYDLAGNLTSEKYPSGRVVTTEYDAAEKVAGVKDQATGLYYAGAAATDVNNRIRYAAHGVAEATRLGNGLWEHTSFNGRLQPEEIGLGASASDSGKLLLAYGYGPAGTNNGNMRTQRISVAGALDLTQTYEYDEVNRLLSARETPTAGGGDTWRQTYTYKDAAGGGTQFGNRRIDTSTDPVTNIVKTTPNAAPQYNPTINPANNRFDDGQGYAYDAAGNLRQDPSHSYAYDAENRLAAVDGGWNGTGGASYQYDGEGRRVRKVSASDTTVFVYDAVGKMVAEYSNQVTYNGISYVTADTLGSTRAVTDKDGGVRSRHDYFPFGEEIGADSTWRAALEYVGDYVRQKFTAKERDGETGLDYFVARYYSSAQGRFTGADTVSGSAPLPQTLNLYAYVQNNPLKFVDPTGHAMESATERDKKLGLSLLDKRRAYYDQYFRRLDQMSLAASGIGPGPGPDDADSADSDGANSETPQSTQSGIGYGSATWNREVFVSICEMVLEYAGMEIAVLSSEQKGIDSDVTIAVVRYSPTLTAGDLSSSVRPQYGERSGRDDRGHIVGQALGGPPVPWNLIWQNPSVNQGAYREFEKGIRRTLTAHQSWYAVLKIEMLYPRSSCDTPQSNIYWRPSGINYSVVYFEGDQQRGLGARKYFPNP